MQGVYATLLSHLELLAKITERTLFVEGVITEEHFGIYERRGFTQCRADGSYKENSFFKVCHEKDEAERTET